MKLFDPLFLYTVSCVTGVSCCACARDELSMVANNSILKRFVFAFECFAGNKDFDLHIENNFYHPLKIPELQDLNRRRGRA